MHFPKYLTLTSILTLTSWGAFSASSLDSLRTERIAGQNFVIHEVEAKETLFAISRRYKTSVGDIVKANESLKSGLKVGQQIRVPYISEAAIPEGSDLHKVASGETLFAISKKYGVSVDELKQWNNLKGNDLSVGQALVIRKSVGEPKPLAEVKEPTPTKTPVQETPQKEVSQKPVAIVEAPKEEVKKAEKVVEEKPSSTPKATASAPSNATPIVPGDWISHEVRSGETLFSIANQYNAPIEDLITWNALSSNNLKVGQVLKVGRAEPGPSKVPIVGEPKVATSIEEMHQVPDGASSGGFKNISEMGQAEVIPGTGGHKKYLVLHRTAPVGTIMRVRNEENDITIFARVVGALPETGDNSKLVIKLSQAAYEQLKAVNSRFPVEVTY
ncbi:LysM peptidoglycan-binding domain-containing protein [Algoriphagus kandeliae]|uniref:LysM peptidoglycan-binding domain-containing protein n=1 Tax=Algoriphagus kandeliae TaxID=2562278 RepID=A0A4Y9QYB5_9BACT|nr:LysM peptidoglycan-binding domain-containing protein [Algoriphagus kandeliae]TFV97474.1 LysM peptidoglycan-binding domain-containing protein [Algoriphagus kandeliae]